MSVEITGLDEVINMLEALSDKERAESIMRNALKQEARKIQRTARLNCSWETKRLQKSIVVEDIPMGVSVGTNAEHAEFVEYGTGKQGDKSVPHTTKEYWRYQDDDGEWHTSKGQPPRPFMYPAFEAHKSEIAPNVKKYIEKELSDG